MVLAGHGWPVLRGTYRDEIGHWHGRSDAVSLRPIDDYWSTAWTLRPVEVANWWNAEPYGVLVACGHGVDCVELPGRHGQRMLDPLHRVGLHPPAMLTPLGTLVLFVRTHTGPRPNLVSMSLRSAGSWVAVPPTGQDVSHGPDSAGGYRWVTDCSPGRVGWQLPELAPVCEVITATVRAGGSPETARPWASPAHRPDDTGASP